MKTLFFCVIGIVFCLHASAQTDFLGRNEKYIKGYIKFNGHYVFQDSSVVSKGSNTVLTLVYHPLDSDTTGLMPLTFILRNDTCKSFMISSFLSDLPVMITSLNRHYQRIDANDWIDKTNTFQATLWKDEKGFYIAFKRL